MSALHTTTICRRGSAAEQVWERELAGSTLRVLQLLDSKQEKHHLKGFRSDTTIIDTIHTPARPSRESPLVHTR